MNRLASEKSPYLLQHKDNPVDWYPWGDEAFTNAKSENKPIFLSIGYSTCHWCHVMEHECFEREDVAQVLNENFISIKVDREERPDVDDLYMTAVQAMTGGGGWPMSVFLTPQGEPFFGGTYFPRERFIPILKRIDDIWREDPGRIREDGKKLTHAIEAGLAEDVGASEKDDWEKFLKNYANHFRHVFDEEYGGFGGAPKFPQSMTLLALMRSDYRSQQSTSQDMVIKTLMSMCRGGMYDHLNGGFHRYSVDRFWLVPHFEKMLYDNAWLTLAYLEAYQIYGEEELALVASETLDYVLYEMTHPEGGFYSAQDADSEVPETKEKEEGYFCTFSWEDLNEVLSEQELSAVQKMYGVGPGGQFEGRNILNLQPDMNRKDKLDPTIGKALEKLSALREGRPKPHLDDKVITSWNGWMISALCKGAQVLNRPAYYVAAKNAGLFLKSNLWDGEQLLRRWRDGESKFSAVSEDYASLISGLLDLYATDFDSQWLRWAVELQKKMDEKFWDNRSAGYFRDDGSDPNVILRLKEDYDGVRPNANSQGAHNLLKLFDLTENQEYLNKAESIFQRDFSRMSKYPSSLPYQVVALQYHLSPRRQVKVGKKAQDFDEFKKVIHQTYAPYVSVIESTEPTFAYQVCENQIGQCLQPEDDYKKALMQLFPQKL